MEGGQESLAEQQEHAKNTAKQLTLLIISFSKAWCLKKNP